MSLALSIIGSLFILAAVLTTDSIRRDKATALLAIGAAAALGKNLLDHNLFWAGVAATGLVLLTGATISYSRDEQKAGEE